MSESSSSDGSEMIAWTADIVASHVQNNSVAISDLPVLIKTVHESLSGLGGEAAAEKPQPAVSVRRSVTPDFIICLEDGRKLKMLKRHLSTAYGMSPEEYREKVGITRRLSDGCTQLCQTTQFAGKEDRSWQTPGRRIVDSLYSFEAMFGRQFFDYTVPIA